MEVFSLGKILPLAALAIAGVFVMHGANLAIPALPSAGSLGRACVTLVFAFLGFESALNPSGEVKDSHRTVPRAVLYALVLVTVLYLAIQMVAEGVLGARLASETAAPLATVAGIVFGSWGSALMLVGALLSTFGYLTGDALTNPRVLFALSEDGVVPPWLSAVHPRYRTPWKAILTHAVLSFALATSGTYNKLIVIANVAVLVLYAVVALGVLRLRAKDVREEGEPFLVAGGPLVPLLAVGVLGYISLQATFAEWLGTLITLVLASGLYVFSLFMRRRTVRAG
jgi:amino acid transporter